MTNRAIFAGLAAVLAVSVLSSGCLPDPRKDVTLPTVGSETHFLSVCTEDADCSAPLSCICGACTIPCNSDGLCSYLEEEARCVHAGPSCSEPVVTAWFCAVRCTDDAACAPEGSCVNGFCQPSSGLLEPTTDPEALPVIVIPCDGDDGDGDGWPDACDPCPGADEASCPVSADDHDGDGIVDGEDADADGDGIPDADESLGQTGSLPGDADTDDDGLSDGVEAELGTDPSHPDSDSDGVQDGTEFGVTEPLRDTRLADFVPDADPTTTTSPRNPDTDRDGLRDGEEDVNHNGRLDPGEGDPLDPTDGLRDSDGDGLIDRDETLIYHTNIFATDSDYDGLDDKIEVNVRFTDPLEPDTDGDGILDGREVECGSDPLDPNSPEDASQLVCEASSPVCTSACDCYGLRGFAFGISCEGGVGRWRCDDGQCVAACGDSACAGCSSCTDPDGDGVSSFVETICQTDPLDGASVPGDGVQDVDGDGIPACRDPDDAASP